MLRFLLELVSMLETLSFLYLNWEFLALKLRVSKGETKTGKNCPFFMPYLCLPLPWKSHRKEACIPIF